MAIFIVCWCSYGSDRAISPAAVSAAMAQLDSRWGLSRQEDAHEFLTALLDALQTEVLTAQVSHALLLQWLLARMLQQC